MGFNRSNILYPQKSNEGVSDDSKTSTYKCSRDYADSAQHIRLEKIRLQETSTLLLISIHSLYYRSVLDNLQSTIFLRTKSDLKNI